MLILISPAKTLDYQSPLATERYTQPELLDYSQQLIREARKLSAPQIASLMSISDKLADLNATRFHEWHPDFTPANARQAILAFKGDVYTGLQAEDFSEADFDFAQQHLRMLSGLYGVLRPLDLMQPYRLEMGIRLENAKGKDLYHFWGDIITDKLNADLLEQTVAEVMHRDPASLRDDATVRDALELFRHRRHGIYPVVDKNNHLRFCLSREDFFDFLKREDVNQESKISGVIPIVLPVCESTVTVRQALEKMVRSGRQKCFVTDGPGGKLSGVLAIMDLLGGAAVRAVK